MELSSARNILLCLRYGIGDLVMEMPVLDALRRHCPGARITALGAHPAIQLLAKDPRVDRLACLQDWGLRHWGDEGSAQIKERMQRWLAAEAFDLVLDPSHAAIGAAEAIWDFQPPILDGGLREEMALMAATGGQAAVKAAVLDGWGLNVPVTAVPRLRLTGEELNWAADYLQVHGLGPGPAGVSPVASSPLKRWPVERFAVLADQLIESPGEGILLFAGPQGRIGHRVLNGMRDPERVVSIGPLHLRKVAALLAACRLFIGNDTGLMHIAAAVGTPVLAFFGPTSPEIYLPSQVPAVALGGRDDCTWRKTRSFGPPECVADGRCRLGWRSCIDQVSLRCARTALEQFQAIPKDDHSYGK